MADYIYLLQNRLSTAQQNALSNIREIAREKSLTVFLVGGAVRDLTSGSPVSDLDVVVQGNAFKLKKDIEKAGGLISGEYEAGQSLFVQFPGGARVEVGSTLSVTYPKPGKPVYKPATILEDLRRRDFTANAMALSLNAGSFGLLMDPLNGVADIENRELRLVSNYGFIEDPIRMVRAARLMARLGWQMDEKTQARYETGKQEGYISAASAFQRGYEAEEIVHEEDALRALKRLESEGWMQFIAPAWSSAKVNVAELEKVREAQTQLQMQGIHPSPAAVNFPLLTAKMTAGEVAELKGSFPRRGFVQEIEALEGEAKQFAAQLSSKAAALPSQAWKMLYAAPPDVVLQVAYASKGAAAQAKLKSFYTEWPQARLKIPYALLLEMRIVPELPGYDAFLDSLVFELMDGKLGTVEEMKAFLEPFSPPAPPPPVHLRKARAAKKDAKAKGRAKKSKSNDDNEDSSGQPVSSPDLGDELTDSTSDVVRSGTGVSDAEEAPEESRGADALVGGEDLQVEAPAKRVAPPAKPAGAAEPSASVQVPAQKVAAELPSPKPRKAVSVASSSAAAKPAASTKKTVEPKAARPVQKSPSKPQGKQTIPQAKKPMAQSAPAAAGRKVAVKESTVKKMSAKSSSKKAVLKAQSGRQSQVIRPTGGKKMVVSKNVSKKPAVKVIPKSVAAKTSAKKSAVKKAASKKIASRQTAGRKPTPKPKAPIKLAAKKRR